MPSLFNYSKELKRFTQLVNTNEKKLKELNEDRLKSIHQLRTLLELYVQRDSLTAHQLVKLLKQEGVSINLVDRNTIDLEQAFEEHLNLLLKSYYDVLDDKDLVSYLSRQTQFPALSREQQPLIDKVHQKIKRLGETQDKELFSARLNRLSERLVLLIQSGQFSYDQNHLLLNLAQLCKNRDFYQKRRFKYTRDEKISPNVAVSLFNWNYSPPPLHKLLQAVDFSIIYVSGGRGIEPGMGHTLLHLGEDKGYVHIDGLYNYPVYISDEEFRDFYLDKWRKRVVAVQKVPLENPDNASKELVKLCQQRWFWGGLWHNCFDFCKQVLIAGGASLEHLNGFSIPSYRLMDLVTVNFRPLDLSKEEQVEHPEPTSRYNKILRDTPIQDCFSFFNGQELNEFIEYAVMNIGSIFIWQKPIQKRLLEQELHDVEDQIKEVKNASEPHEYAVLLNQRTIINDKLDNIEETTAQIIVNNLVNKILTTDWQRGRTIQITQLDGRKISKPIPENMISMLNTHDLGCSQSKVNYLDILNKMCLVAFRAGLNNNSIMSWIRGRTEQTKNFYRLFVDMAQVNSFFKQAKSVQEPPKLDMDTHHSNGMDMP
ncbi:hypothetical protein [Legionella quateirensis]|uniref:Uncharacterized protein n=1 Tax=Legionella quateirensis TaxID=45072 RepID=A0A378KQL7_9GAMM|nr:hypothetical protein [Legionella quateirensis]KTD54695.1 hypothetical protein Lqua_0202 [Legionella quateirensis]STY16873.1 Uncharacterised protein [Legionella quateirensis]